MKHAYKETLLLIVACLAFFAAPSAQAYRTWPIYQNINGNLLPQGWLVECNNGYITTVPVPTPTPPQDAVIHNLWCRNHGGVADVTDNDVITALQTITGPSSWVLGEQLSTGGYRAVSLPELVALTETAGPDGLELPGYEVLSLNVNGTELLPDAIPLEPSIPLYAIYSNDDDTGLRVGGATYVPEPGSALVLGVGLAALGLRRRTSS